MPSHLKIISISLLVNVMLAFALMPLFLMGASMRPFGPFWGSTVGAPGITATPVLAPSGFTSPGHGPQTVVATCSTAGAQGRYTTDGSNPTFSHGTLFSSFPHNFTASGNSVTLIRVVAFVTSGDVSAIAEGEYDFSPG